MAQIIELQIKGLHTSGNNFSETPKGALSKAQNIVIDKDSIAESRRGFQRANVQADNDDRIDKLSSYQGKIIGRRSNDNGLSYYSGSSWVDYSGTYLHPDADYGRMKFTDFNGNKYFTTSMGMMVLDAIAGPVYTTGMPRGLDGEAALSGASGFMANNTQVAYRIVWGTRDANSNLYLGAPSQRIIISNASGGTRDVALTFTIPSGITTGDFYQVYRSGQSATSSTEPNDELQLVYEANPSAGEITAKSVTYTDLTPDSLKGAYLYSNANQEGIAESNDIPPLVTDICSFKNFMFFGNVSTKYSITIKLLSVGGSLGLAVNDTITINSMVFTGKASETVASSEFKVTTSGSASQNIDDTARSLVKVVNQYASNTSVYAYYVSGYADLPGQIFIEQRLLSGPTFAVAVSRSSAWDITDGNADNASYPHGLMWSKIQQPEHVPASHLELIGSKNSPIRRILALRDSLFILKDDGVWRLTGNNGSWTIDPLDTSTHILAPESAVVLNNQIFALTDQGIVTISDIGVAVISRPIEDQINNLLGLNYTSVKKYSFGVSYETERKYLLWTITNSGDTTATQAFVYNTFTRAWTVWDKGAITGFISEDNCLYLAAPDFNYLSKERKSFSNADFADEELGTFNIVSYVGTNVVLDTIANLSIGDMLYQASSVINSPIVSIDPLTTSVTVNDVNTWVLGSVDILKGIDCQLEWTNQACENPGVEKHFQEAVLIFKKQNFVNSQISFYTDLSGGYEPSTLAGTYGSGLWGAAAWGTELWGGISRPKPLRAFIPREKSRGSIISVKYGNRQGFSEFSIQGISLQFEFVSERVNRD